MITFLCLVPQTALLNRLDLRALVGGKGSGFIKEDSTPTLPASAPARRLVGGKAP
jgi:hypothetical protein